MANICTYIYDPNILTQRKVNAEFALLHKHVCYLESQTAGSGTVSSVGLALPAIFTVTNSPVTTSGTLTGTFTTQTANTVFSGPGTGAAAAPTFRALVAADIPAPVAFSGITIGSIGGAKAINLGQVYDAGISNGFLQYNTEIPLNGHFFTIGSNGVLEFTVGPTANILAAGSTSGSLTTPGFSLQQILNTSGIVSSFLVNVLNSASGGGTQIQELQVNSTRVLGINLSGQISAKRNGVATGTFHAGASTTAAGTAPIKLDTGVLMTTTEAGAIEYDGTHLYFTATNAGTRFQLDQQTGALIKYQHSIFIPTTGGTVNLVNGQYNIINPAGALLALTLNLPSSPANNDTVYIKFTQNITTVTYANGTVVDGITAPTAGGLTILVYDSGTTSWY